MNTYDETKYELYFETTGKGIEVAFTHMLDKLDVELIIEDIEAGETTFDIGGYHGVLFKAQKGVYWEIRNYLSDTVVEWDFNEKMKVYKEHIIQ